MKDAESKCQTDSVEKGKPLWTAWPARPAGGRMPGGLSRRVRTEQEEEERDPGLGEEWKRSAGTSIQRIIPTVRRRPRADPKFSTDLKPDRKLGR